MKRRDFSSYNRIMKEWVGKTLGRVRIDHLLARGGMAEVYLGTHTTLQRQVVVKILRSQFEDMPALLERFEREARVVAALRHPNIVQVFDFDALGDQPFIVMEYIRGPSLSTYLKSLKVRLTRPGLPQIGRILTGVADALQYAHESGVIHRDVKPGNILLTSRTGRILPGEPLPPNFQAVLTDFGLVRILRTDKHTTLGNISGTPAYMSPEQARGEQTDERTDIYSLGVVLYELLAGHVPFDGETTMSVLLKHVHEPPPPVPGLSLALQSVLDHALAKDPAERFQSPKEFADAFNVMMQERSEAHTVQPLPPVTPPLESKPEPVTTPPPAGYRRWGQAFVATAAIVALGASVVFGAFAPGGGRTPTASPTFATDTPASLPASPLGPTGVLHFHDGRSILDSATLTALAMPAPPAAGQYEVWLSGRNGTERRSLGTLELDANGRGTLTYASSRGQNLLSIYDKVEVTVRHATVSSSDSPSDVVYSYALPESGLEFVRRLLVAQPGAPREMSQIQALVVDTRLIDETTRAMLDAHQNGDLAGIHTHAEQLMNILSGRQSPDYKDWNGDGQIDDPGNGYGFSLNGDNLGHIQAVYANADYASNAPGASQYMVANGEHVKACAQNLAQWSPDLGDRITKILEAGSLADLDQPLNEAVALASQLLNGLDRNEDGSIDSSPGECGVLALQDYAYHMADMPLLPARPSETATPDGTATITPTLTPSPVFVRPTHTSVRDPAPVVDTPAPPTGGGGGQPTNKPRPTKKPSSTPKPKQNKN